MANQLGGRFQCDNCGTMVLCTTSGEGSIYCCDKEMSGVQAKKLPSSD